MNEATGECSGECPDYKADHEVTSRRNLKLDSLEDGELDTDLVPYDIVSSEDGDISWYKSFSN